MQFGIRHRGTSIEYLHDELVGNLLCGLIACFEVCKV